MKLVTSKLFDQCIMNYSRSTRILKIPNLPIGLPFRKKQHSNISICCRSLDLNSSLLFCYCRISVLQEKVKNLTQENLVIEEIKKKLKDSQKNNQLLVSSYADVFRQIRSFRACCVDLKDMVTRNSEIMRTSLATATASIEVEAEKGNISLIFVFSS